MPTVQPAAGLLIAGKYRLLERIGVGGMSEVYRADNTLIGRTVALKLLHPDQASDRGLAARFFQEAQSLSKIRHPGIVDVLDAGEGETGPFIVMEYLSGESAAQLLARQGKLSVEAAVATLLPVLAALQTAHDAGIIHRDLKPENVFYAVEDSAVRVKLLDFGIAKLLWPSGPTPRTSTGVVFGTPDYLSPEQASGEVNVDARSDVFSAGVVLFELVTNVRPFHAPTAVATAYKVAHARTPSAAEHGGPADPTLQAIVARALQKRPEERYQSAREFAAELARFAAPTRELEQALATMVRPSRPSGVRATGTIPDKPTSSADPPISARSDERSLVTTPQPHSSGRLRSLPSRFLGQCHARGIVLRAVDEHVKKSVPAEARAALLLELGDDTAQDLQHGTVQGIVHYDLAIVTSYLDLATRRFHERNTGWCKQAGSSSVDSELSALLRTALRPDAPLLVLRRVVPLVSRLFDFGIWEVRPEGAQRVSVRVTDFEPASLPLRLWLAGVLEGSLRVCDSRPHLTIARGDAGFSPHLVFDVSML